MRDILRFFSQPTSVNEQKKISCVFECVIYQAFFILTMRFSNTRCMRNVKVCIIKSTFFSFSREPSCSLADWADQCCCCCVGSNHQYHRSSTNINEKKNKTHNFHYQRRFIHHTLHMLTIWLHVNVFGVHFVCLGMTVKCKHASRLANCVCLEIILVVLVNRPHNIFILEMPRHGILHARSTIHSASDWKLTPKVGKRNNNPSVFIDCQSVIRAQALFVLFSTTSLTNVWSRSIDMGPNAVIHLPVALHLSFRMPWCTMVNGVWYGDAVFHHLYDNVCCVCVCYMCAVMQNGSNGVVHFRRGECIQLEQYSTAQHRTVQHTHSTNTQSTQSGCDIYKKSGRFLCV